MISGARAHFRRCSFKSSVMMVAHRIPAKTADTATDKNHTQSIAAMLTTMSIAGTGTQDSTEVLFSPGCLQASCIYRARCCADRRGTIDEIQGDRKVCFDGRLATLIQLRNCGRL